VSAWLSKSPSTLLSLSCLMYLLAGCGPEQAPAPQALAEPLPQGATSGRVSTLALPRSCKELKANNPSLASGNYTLDPCGTGTGGTYYCDMTRAGGGWTVAGWQAASATTNMGIVNRGTVGAAAGWSKNLACVPYSEIMVFNRTYGDVHTQTYAASTWNATATDMRIGSPPAEFRQGADGPTSPGIMMGCVNYNYPGYQGVVDWACDSDWTWGVRGHIADYAGEFCPTGRFDIAVANGRMSNPWGWTDGSSCKYLGQPYSWGFAIR
jgi:hypothetical protein